MVKELPIYLKCVKMFNVLVIFLICFLKIRFGSRMTPKYLICSTLLIS